MAWLRGGSGTDCPPHHEHECSGRQRACGEYIHIRSSDEPADIRTAPLERILADTSLEDEHARKLKMMSSVLPESYREMLVEADYQLSPGALMMLPGTCSELVSIGFQMSAATPVR